MVVRKSHVGTVLCVGLLMALVRTYLVTSNMEKNIYENDTYYLPSDSFAISLFTFLSVFFLLLFAYFAFSLGRHKEFEIDHRNAFVSCSACVLSFMLLGAVAMFFLHYSEKPYLPENMELITVIFAVVSAVVFLVVGLRSNSRKTLAVAMIFPIFFSVFRLINDFIKISAAPMASSGAYHILSLTVVLLYFLSEGKSLANKCGTGFYFFYGYASIFLLLVYSVPNILMHCFGVFLFDYTACFSVVDVGLVIYIASRMSTVNLLSPKNKLSELNVRGE